MTKQKGRSTVSGSGPFAWEGEKWMSTEISIWRWSVMEVRIRWEYAGRSNRPAAAGRQGDVRQEGDLLRNTARNNCLQE